MNLAFKFHSTLNPSTDLLTENQLLVHFEAFKKVVTSDEVGFFQLTDDASHLSKAISVYNQFKHKKTFVQVGIGGSALGPQMLIDALKSTDVNFLFLDNIDPDYTHDQFESLPAPKEVLFYIVSKSGGTAETMAQYFIARNWLLSKGVSVSDLAHYFVFCTDPKTGDLRAHGLEQGIVTLDVPSNIGGRFSILTAVGLFPALFAGINIHELYAGANEIKKEILTKENLENPMLAMMAHLVGLYGKYNVNQTVFMPYSSKLKTLGPWFVQLWAESLGKINSKTKERVGLTPIPAYGATDQHSQMQLFMEGPRNKCMILLNLDSFTHEYALSNNLDFKAATQLEKHSLGKLMQAEFQGTIEALKAKEIPLINITLDKLDASNTGALILFFEALTTLMGIYLEVDPFNQPGVELGKINAYRILAQ